MLTVENADKALKDYYLDAVSAQLDNNISPFFSAIEKNSDHVFGKDVKLAVVRGGSGSIFAGAEDGDLPEPYKNRYLDITLPLKNLYGTIEVSDKAVRASRDKSGAFINLLDAEMEGLVQAAKDKFQRMLFGDGTGLMCTVGSVTTDKKYKVDKVDKSFVGTCVDVYPSATGVMDDSYGLIITAVDETNKTVTFDREVLDSLVNGKMYLHGCKDGELTGLGAIFDSPKLYGYTKTAEPYFAPYVADGGGSLTEDKMCGVLDALEEQYGSRINMIICSFNTRKKIAALVANNKRIVNSIDVNTGFGAVTVNGIKVYADKYCPDGRILFLNTDDFCLCQLCDWEWLEDESGKILKQVRGKAAYGATLVKYAELVCKKPCAQGMLKNI